MLRFDWDYTSAWFLYLNEIKAQIESDLSAVQAGGEAVTSNSFYKRLDYFAVEGWDDPDYAYYFIPIDEIKDVELGLVSDLQVTGSLVNDEKFEIIEGITGFFRINVAPLTCDYRGTQKVKLDLDTELYQYWPEPLEIII